MTSDDEYGGFQVIDLTRKEYINHVHHQMEQKNDKIDALAITSDGKHVLLGTEDTHDVHFYDPVTGQKVKTIRGKKKVHLHLAKPKLFCFICCHSVYTKRQRRRRVNAAMTLATQLSLKSMETNRVTPE